jgi:hypothetical protein
MELVMYRRWIKKIKRTYVYACMELASWSLIIDVRVYIGWKSERAIQLTADARMSTDLNIYVRTWIHTYARARGICWCAPGFRSTLSGPIGTAHSIVILITYSYSTAMALLLVKHCNNRQDREREDYQRCAPQCIWVRTYFLSSLI